jgi:cell division control protein 6
MRQRFSVFKDESKLDINYVPSRLPHRDAQLSLLDQFFRSVVETPGKTAQRVLITGNIGTGKTVLSQHFGLQIIREAREKGVNLHFVHVNCRECKGSLFMILHQVISRFHPNFPRRGYSSTEILQMLIQVLDAENAFIILVLDELDALIRNEGSDPLYNLSRIQEGRLNAPQRLSLICILRETEYLDLLDPSTKSTLQRNIISLEEYSKSQLRDILNDRADMAFKQNAVSPSVLDFITELASSERGDARYAIELLWRAGKYADTLQLPIVSPENVRAAAASVYPVVRKDEVFSLGFHEKLFLLGIARYFRQTGSAYVSMGDAEKAYAVVCEEYGKKGLRHTQLWKYVTGLAASGIIETKPSAIGQRGKTTIISLPKVPAEDLERELVKFLSAMRRY